MLKMLLPLFCEIVLLLLTSHVLYKHRSMKFLVPIIITTLCGGVVEVLSLLSDRSVMLLPSTTNWYTYRLLTLVEFLCLLWLTSFFTKERRTLIASAAVFIALWGAAKISIEPFHLFDSTTFALLNLAILVCVGCIALNVSSNITDGKKESGLSWILAGYALYAFVSLTVPTVTNYLEQNVRQRAWWLNDFGFWLKTICIVWGLIHLRAAPYTAAQQDIHPHFTSLTLLPVGLTGIFLYKLFVFPASNVEYAITVVAIGSIIVAYYVSASLKITINSFAEERSKRLVAEELNEAQKISTEYAIKDIANATIQLRDLIEEEERDQALKTKLIRYVDLLTVTCFRLVKNSKPK